MGGVRERRIHGGKADHMTLGEDHSRAKGQELNWWRDRVGYKSSDLCGILSRVNNIEHWERQRQWSSDLGNINSGSKSERTDEVREKKNAWKAFRQNVNHMMKLDGGAGCLSLRWMTDVVVINLK